MRAVRHQKKKPGATGLTVFGAALWALCAALWPAPGQTRTERSITDALGRQLSVPHPVERVICSGAGCLRLLTYLGAQDRIVAVDSIELRGSPLDARPYAIANPNLKNYPLFGGFRGHDNPELIAALDPQPQVIFKTFAGRGADPDQLQTKTGIPVVALAYGNLTDAREDLNRSLRLMADVIDQKWRAETVIAFFDQVIGDLQKRTRDIPRGQRPSSYIGGLGQGGPHGLQSTDPAFAPFVFTHTPNVAGAPASRTALSHASVAKEQIVFWDPEVIFLDVSTLRLGAGANARDQLQTEAAYQGLQALRSGQVYGLFPSNSYNQNFEAILANAYYVGKLLYPRRFEDVDPIAKAEELSVFLNGGPAFEALNKQFDGLGFSRIPFR